MGRGWELSGAGDLWVRRYRAFSSGVLYPKGGDKVGTRQAKGRALNSDHCLAGRVAGDTKRRSNSVPVARKVLRKRKKRKEGRNWWERKKTKKSKSRPQIRRYPRSILAAWKPLANTGRSS